MNTLHRIGVFAASLLILAALSEVVGKAAVTIATPNSAVINYTLASGATSSPVTPATNQPVIIIGSNTGTTDFAVSTVTMVHIPTIMMRWIGIEAGTGAVIHNGSSALGTHIIWLDESDKIDLEVFSADQFVIHNGASTSESGTVKLIW
jgi:hypothetical protein